MRDFGYINFGLMHVALRILSIPLSNKFTISQGYSHPCRNIALVARF